MRGTAGSTTQSSAPASTETAAVAAGSAAASTAAAAVAAVGSAAASAVLSPPVPTDLLQRSIADWARVLVLMQDSGDDTAERRANRVGRKLHSSDSDIVRRWAVQCSRSAALLRAILEAQPTIDRTTLVEKVRTEFEEGLTPSPD